MSISQTVTDRLLLPTHIKWHVAFRLAYLRVTLTRSKGQGQGHFFTINISQTVIDMANIAVANTENRMWTFDWHIYI